MGQAKSRGSREQRIEQAKARNMEQARRRAEGFARAEENMKHLAAALRAADPSQVTETTGEDPAARLLSGHIMVGAGKP